MEAKLKAQELFNKYHALSSEIDELDEYSQNEHAKQCAIIAVKELIKAIPVSVPGIGYGNAMFVNPDVRYWQEVLTELEKM